MIGKTIDGRYRILGVLGEGGMGAVYEAEHTGTGRRVALKVIHARMSGKTEMVARFQREARAVGAIETPHIVQVLDTGTDPGTGVIYMAMELLRGEDVHHLLTRLGQLPTELSLRLVGQACVGLGKAHEAGVIHRDVKPANLFLSRRGSGEILVKVVDFGIAKMVARAPTEETGLTRTGGMVGSPLYMSPEQVAGSKAIDRRTDVWSLGVVLYKALAGRAPHAGCESDLKLMMEICATPAPPLQDLAPWVPPEVARLVHRMLSRALDERFPSMEAVLEAILPHVPRGLSVRAGDLVALGEAEQQRVAPRLVLLPREEVTDRGGAASAIPAPAIPAPAISAPAISAPAIPAPAIPAEHWNGEAGLSISRGTTAAPPRRSRIRLALVLALPLGLGGLSVYALRDRPAAVAASAPAASAPPALPPDERTVRLVVEPADATVEVDGRPTRVDDGGVALRGAIGSVHHVRLVKGSLETVAEVAITSLGALPPGLRLEARVEATAQRAPLNPSGSAGARRSPPAGAAAPRPRRPTPADKFE